MKTPRWWPGSTRSSGSWSQWSWLYRAYQRRRQDLEDAEALMGDPDMKELAQE